MPLHVICFGNLLQGDDGAALRRLARLLPQLHLIFNRSDSAKSALRLAWRQRSGRACLLGTTCSGFHDLDPNMLLLEATFSAPRRRPVKGRN